MAEAPEWYSPDTTIWLTPNATTPERQAAFAQVIGKGDLCLAREVRARLPGEQLASDHNPGPYTDDVLRELAALADDEFTLLREEHGIETPLVGWHVTERGGRPCLVANIRIVDGVALALCGIEKLQGAFDSLCSYQANAAPGHRLADLTDRNGQPNEDQFVIGRIRDTPSTPASTGRRAFRNRPQVSIGERLFNIDPEPLF